MRARILTGAWEVPAVFRLLQEIGGLSDSEMRRTFNMGIGMVACVPPGTGYSAVRALAEAGEQACVIGSVEQEATVWCTRNEPAWHPDFGARLELRGDRR